MEVQWKTLPNLSRYEFGSNGDIKNVRDGNMLHVNGRERLNNQCNLKDDNGKIVRKTIHRVVLELFGIDKKTTRVVRKDGNDFNNAIENLNYVDEVVDDETWMPFPENVQFEISRIGKIRNTRTGVVFEGRSVLQGYLTTIIQKKNYFVHVIVAKTYIPNPDNAVHVTHINGNVADNRVENLEWVQTKSVEKPTQIEQIPFTQAEPQEPTEPQEPVTLRKGSHPILMLDAETKTVMERFEYARLAAEWVYRNVYRREPTPDDIRREGDRLRDHIRHKTTFVDHGYIWMDEPDAQLEVVQDVLVKDPGTAEPKAVVEKRPGSKPILMMYADTRTVAKRFAFARSAAEWVYVNVYKRDASPDDIRRESDSLRDKFRTKKSFAYHGYLWEEEPSEEEPKEKPAEKHKKKLEAGETEPKKVKPEKHLNGRAVLKMTTERQVVETYACARHAATWMFRQEHEREPDEYETGRVAENLREVLRRNGTVNRMGFLWEFKAPLPDLLDGEVWKEMDESYSISNMGRLKTPTGIKDTFNSDNGYYVVKISTDTQIKRLHRLVATAFHENPEGKAEVNHINGNKLDNRAENLEWTTHTENVVHANETGLKKRMRVAQYDMDGKELARFKSTSDAAEKLGLTKTQVFNVCSGRSKQTNGFVFAYLS